jgi:hypothetical protein
MKAAIGALILAQAVTLLPAGQSSSQISENKQWTIEGDVVTDAGPATGAHIRVSGPESLAAVSSDVKGHYVLKGLVSGTFLLNALKDGAAPSEPKAIRVLAGKRVEPVDFHLDKMAVISGRVLDAGRGPVQGASVCACVKLHHDGRMRLVIKQCGETDDLGQYRIADLSKGPHILIIGPQILRPHKRLPAANRSSRATKDVMTLARTSFYPGVESLQAAAPIMLSQGMEYGGADIVLPQAPSFCVRATVVPYSREPSAVLLLNQPIGDSFITIAKGTVTSGQDSEICGVSPGQYWLQATLWDPETRKADGFVQAQVVVTNRDIEAGTLSPVPGTDLQGKVSVTEESKDDDSMPGNLSVVLARRGRPILYGEDLTSSVRPDGAFTIRNVFLDEYGLSVSGLPDGYYLREAKQQGIDVMRGSVQPGRGELLISLASGAAVISGRAVDTDDHPVPDAMIVLLPAKTSDRDSIVTRQADQDGGFKFGGIAPGQYQLLALRGLFEGEAEDPTFVATQVSASVEVSVEMRSAQVVNLKVRNVH